MEDVSPKLLERVQKTFDEICTKDKQLEKLKEAARDYEGLDLYAERLGDNLARAFRVIGAEDLPKGRMYYNIADKVVRPLLEDNWNTVVQAGIEVQKGINAAAGIGLKPIIPKPESDRIYSLTFKISEYENFADAQWLLGEPVTNIIMRAADAMAEGNALFQHNAGVETRFTRNVRYKCCDWCAERAGTWTYFDMPDDFWGRHEHCRCTIDYKPEKGKGYRMNTSGNAFIRR